MKILHILALSSALILGIAGGCAGAHAQEATNSLPVATPVDASTLILQALPPNLSPWLMLIPLLVPGVVALFKSLFPNIPSKWLPVLAFAHGPGLVLLDKLTGVFGHDPIAVLALGAAGVGVREIYDQWKPNEGTITVTGAGGSPGERGHVQFKLLVLVAGLTALLAICAGCASTPPADIVSATQSTFGLDVSADPSSSTPHVRLGFIRTQYHRVPTATNGIYAPSLISGINIDTSFTSSSAINEEFATGLGIGIYDTNRVGLATARARANAAAASVPGVGVNAPLAAPLTNAPPITAITNADGSILFTR